MMAFQVRCPVCGYIGHFPRASSHLVVPRIHPAIGCKNDGVELVLHVRPVFDGRIRVDAEKEP